MVTIPQIEKAVRILEPETYELLDNIQKTALINSLYNKQTDIYDSCAISVMDIKIIEIRISDILHLIDERNL